MPFHRSPADTPPILSAHAAPDPQFFTFRESVSLDEILEVLEAAGVEVEAGQPLAGVPSQFVGLCPLSTAGPNQISFFHNARYLDDLASCQAGLILVPDTLATSKTWQKPVLRVSDVHRAMALVGHAFVIDPVPDGQHHPSAVVAHDAEIGAGVTLGPQVVVAAGARIGARSYLGALSYVGPKVLIGDDCTIDANVTLTHTIMGHGVCVKPGARLGQRGFGWALGPRGHVPKPQVGRVVVGDGVEIGANTVIDRGSLHDTVIGAGTVIDNLCHIAHNCRIGRFCAVAGASAFAGTTILGDFVQIGGFVASKGHVTVGDGAIVRIDSFIGSNIGAGQDVAGRPARPIGAYRRLLRHWSRAARGANTSGN